MTVPDHNFTKLPGDVASNKAAPIPSVSEQRRRHQPLLSKAPTLLLVLGVVSLIGSLGYSIANNTIYRAPRAATENLQPASTRPVDLATLELTKTFTSIPRRYKGQEIPANLASEGLRAYPEMSENERQAYVINRIVLYYTLKDILDQHNIPYRKIEGDLTFTAIENVLDNMKGEFDFNLVHRANFAFVKAYFSAFDNDYRARAAFGDKLQEKALEKITYYHKKMKENPTRYQDVLDEANSDPELILLNNGESNLMLWGYFADQNNVPEQEYFIFDEEFDDILFKQLSVNQVSDIMTLNSMAPYMYVFAYPIKIERKQYQSFRDVIKEKAPLFD